MKRLKGQVVKSANNVKITQLIAGFLSCGIVDRDGIQWKKHPTTDYIVSEYGEIINLETGYQLKPTLSKGGYFKISNDITRSGMVHSAVVESFTGEIIPKGMCINHKDGIKINNHISNLEVVTPAENTNHAYRTGLANGKFGEENSAAKVTEQDILEMYKMFEEGKNNTEVGKRFNIHDRYVSLVRHGKRWKHLYDKVGKVFSESYTEVVVTKESIIKAWELIKTTNLMNKEIADITGIEVSSISRLRHGKYAKKIIQDYEKPLDNP